MKNKTKRRLILLILAITLLLTGGILANFILEQIAQFQFEQRKIYAYFLSFRVWVKSL